MHAGYILTQWIRRAKTSLKKYTSHLYCKVCVWEGVGDRTELQYIDPHSYGHQRCVFLILLMLNGGLGAHSASFLYCILSPTGLVPKLHRGSQGPLLLGGGFLYPILSLTHLISNSLTSFLIELYNSSIAHSILEWHVCSSSNGNNCHAVQRSLSSGASVYECTRVIYLVPYFQLSPPYTISSNNCHRNVSLPCGASLWNGMFGWVEGQYTTLAIFRKSKITFFSSKSYSSSSINVCLVTQVGASTYIVCMGTLLGVIIIKEKPADYYEWIWFSLGSPTFLPFCQTKQRYRKWCVYAYVYRDVFVCRWMHHFVGLLIQKIKAELTNSSGI